MSLTLIHTNKKQNQNTQICIRVSTGFMHFKLSIILFIGINSCLAIARKV